MFFFIKTSTNIILKMFVSAFLTVAEIKRFLFFNVKMQKYPKVIKVNVKSSDERKMLTNKQTV